MCVHISYAQSANLPVAVDYGALRIPTFDDSQIYMNVGASEAGITEGEIVHPALADLDGDRDLDLILGLEDGKLAYFENTGSLTNPSFTKTALSSLDSVDVGDRAAPALADLDHDGDMDLVVGNDSGALRYYLNNGDAFTANFTRVTGNSNPLDGFSVSGHAVPAIGDINNDNLLDVLLGSRQGTVSVLVNTGTVVAPVFSDTETTNLGTLLSNRDFGTSSVPILADPDLDTDVDLIVGARNQAFSFFFNSRGGYQNDTQLDIEDDVIYTMALYDSGWYEIGDNPANPLADLDITSATDLFGTFGDLDGDLDLDFLLGDEDGILHLLEAKKLTKLLGVPDSDITYHNLGQEFTEFTPAYRFWYAEGEPGGPTTMDDMWNTRAAGDLTGDGILDFVFLESSFSYSVNIRPIGTSIAWIEAKDWNRWNREEDQATEFIYTDYDSTATDQKYAIGHVQLVDFDRDGDLDLIVGGSREMIVDYKKTHSEDIEYDRLGYFENQGDATWPDFVELTGDDNPLKDIEIIGGMSWAPSFVDLDGDGDLDCVLGFDSSGFSTVTYGDVIYWENTGTPASASFVWAREEDNPLGDLDGGSFPFKKMVRPYFADFDRDGDLDLFFYNTNNLFVPGFSTDTQPNASDSTFPVDYDYYENTGSATNPRFWAVTEEAGIAEYDEDTRDYVSFGWDAQAELGSPLHGLFRESREFWYEAAAQDFPTPTEGLEHYAIADFNYDGIPDFNLVTQQLNVFTFKRMMDDQQPPTVIGIVSGNVEPFTTTEDLTFEFTFDEEIDRLRLDDFELTDGNGSVVDISAATLSGSGSVYLLDFANVSLSAGDYDLTLVAANSYAHDAFGYKIQSDASYEFEVFAITSDVQLSINGPQILEYGESVTYFVTASNGASTNSASNSVSVRFPQYLANLSISNVATNGTVGGASGTLTTTTLSTGMEVTTLTDTISLSASSSVTYTVTGQVVNIPDNATSENTATLLGTMSPSNGFNDQLAYNNIAAVHLQIEPLAGVGGVLSASEDIKDINVIVNSLPPNVMDIGDINGDGYADIVVLDYVDGYPGFRSLFYINGSLDQEKTFYDAANIFEMLSIRLADVDNDGDLDILAVAAVPFGFFFDIQSIVLSNDGSGTFTYNTSQTGISDNSTPEIGDFDNDGDIDLFFDDSLSLNVDDDPEIYINDGSGSFSVHSYVPTSYEISYATADLNGDGYLDLVSNTGIHLQDPKKSDPFELSQSLTLGTEAEVVVADFDGDGDLDIAAARAVNAFYTNDGNGYFTKVDGVLSTEARGVGVKSGDFDGDGTMDLVLALRTSYQVFDAIRDGEEIYIDVYGHVLLQYAGYDPVNQVFASSKELSRDTDAEILSIGIGDFTGDNGLDVVMVDQKDRTIDGVLNFDWNILSLIPLDTAPEITLNGEDTLSVAVGGTYVEPGVASVSDDIDSLQTTDVTIDSSSVDSDTIGTYTVSYTITDSSGNMANVTRIVVVQDLDAPTITLTGSNPYVLEVGASYIEPGASATDNVDSAEFMANNLWIDASAVDTTKLGSYTVTYDVSDTSGNAATTVERTVSVVDTTPPEITLLGSNPFVVSVGGSYSEPGATASDNYDSSLGSISIDSSAVNTATLGSYTVTYDISDASGNAATTVGRTVNVVDNTPPVITLIGSNLIEVSVGNTYVELGATALDNYDSSLGSITVDSSSVDTATVGSYTVTYDISDASGNTATTVERTVNVVDRVAPVITLTGDNPLKVEVGGSYSEPGANASDNYDDSLGAITIDSTDVDTTVVGSYEVRYDISDSSGNAATTVIRTVNVVDETAPVITLIGDNPLKIAVGGSYIEPGASATDNYDDPLGSITIDSADVDTTVVGSYEVRYDISDSSENASTTVIRTVNVVDETAPVITLIGDNPFEVEAGGIYSEPGASATDNYDGSLGSITIDSSSVNTSLIGSFTVSYDISDASGNRASTVERTVNVIDSNPPYASNVSLTGTTGEAVSFAVAKFAGDTDGDALTVTTSDAGNGTVVSSNSIITYTSQSEFSGSDSFTYTVTNEFGAFATATVSITVTPVSISDGSQSMIGLEVVNNELKVGFAGIPGVTYMLQESTDLVEWIDVEEITIPANGVSYYMITDPPTPTAFYRLRYGN